MIGGGPLADLVITGGRLIDGTGGVGRLADVAVRGGKVTAIGEVAGTEGLRVIDASDCVVAPGFIDVHSHADLIPLVAPSFAEKLAQCVTTDVVGNCGISVAPATDESVGTLAIAFSKLLGVDDEDAVDWTWRTYGEYLERVRDAEPALNLAALVGHAALRATTLGVEPRPATDIEIGSMAGRLRQSLDQGAIGLSTGSYLCAGLADVDELTALCRIVAEYDGIFAYHLPDYGAGLLESIELACEIALQTDVKVHVSHLKARGEANWPLFELAVKRINRARDSGFRVTADLYPYEAGASAAWSIFPVDSLGGGVEELLRRLDSSEWRRDMERVFARDESLPGWLNIEREVGWHNAYVSGVSTTMNKQYEGMNFEEIARSRQTTPLHALIDLLREERGQVTYVLFDGSLPHIERLIAEPWVMVGSDGIYGGHPHPRLFGTFARVLARLVRDQQLLPWEDAIWKMTGLAAATFGLEDRGTVEVGKHADLVVFEPSLVTDRATYEIPEVPASGVVAVVLNGQVALDESGQTSVHAGRILRSYR